MSTRRLRPAIGYLDPWLLRVRLQELRPEERARREQVIARQDLSALDEFVAQQRTRRGRRVAGSVWAVGMVRDDADVIGPAIRHLVAQGVDQVLIAANLCPEETWRALDAVSSELPVIVVRDEMEGYYQAIKMTQLARAAASAGADWVVPFDADELWFGAEATLKETLVESRVPILHARIWNYVASCADDPREADPVRRIQWREHVPAVKTKVAFRAHARARLRMGNHGVTRPGYSAPGLEIAHFPYRSEAQFVRKLRRGLEVMAATDLDDAKARHWRTLGTVDEDRLHRLWEGMRAGAGLEDDAWITGAPRVHDPVAAKRVWTSAPARPV